MKGLFSGLILLVALATALPAVASPTDSLRYFRANDPMIRYTGRIDFSNRLAPRFWSPGVYIEARFRGSACKVVINDEELYGDKHNYVELVVDGRATRVQTTGKNNTITIPAEGLDEGEHTLAGMQEHGIKYQVTLSLPVWWCRGLAGAPRAPVRKMEFIGNSITCGAGSDISVVPCGAGKWEDQHNAYMAYGPRTARLLHARWHLTAVSGIGLMHSCCKLEILMPQVFDKVQLRTDSIPWDFSTYFQPDVVTVCLGQNDGIQDSVIFLQ